MKKGQTGRRRPKERERKKKAGSREMKLKWELADSYSISWRQLSDIDEDNTVLQKNNFIILKLKYIKLKSKRKFFKTL